MRKLIALSCVTLSCAISVADEPIQHSKLLDDLKEVQTQLQLKPIAEHSRRQVQQMCRVLLEAAVSENVETRSTLELVLSHAESKRSVKPYLARVVR